MRYLGGVLAREQHGTWSYGEVGGIENDEASIGDDVEVDVDWTGEFARDEVRFEPYIIPLGDGEFR